METSEAILKIKNIEVKYHEVILVLKGVSIEVPRGGMVALLLPESSGTPFRDRQMQPGTQSLPSLVCFLRGTPPFHAQMMSSLRKTFSLT